MTFGLLSSAAVTFAFGMEPGIYGSLYILIAAVLALLVLVLVRDTPQSCGLPPIGSSRNDCPPDYTPEHEGTFTCKEIFFRHVINNKYLWAIAVANAFVYFVRYGVVDWIPTSLQTAKGLSFQQSSVAWAAFEFAGIPGTLLCGWNLDRLFKGSRPPATIRFMAMIVCGLFSMVFSALTLRHFTTSGLRPA